MKPFKTFVKENKTPSGTYVAINFMPETVSRLEKMFNQIKLNPEAIRIEPSKYHCTLVYDEHSPYIKGIPSLSGTSLTIESPSFEIFGQSKDKSILVYHFKCPELTRRNKELYSLYGIKSEYPEYKAHISLAYNVGTNYVIPDNLQMVYELAIKDEFFEPIKEDYYKT